MKNVRFDYQYRDAGNYKWEGMVVFKGPLDPQDVVRLKAALDVGEYFVAKQIGIPSIFPETWGKDDDDHCWHELIEVTETHSSPTDPRSFSEFVAEVEKVSGSPEGWKIYDPPAWEGDGKPSEE